MSTWQVFNMTIAVLAVVIGIYNIYWRYKNDRRIKKEAMDREFKADRSKLSNETLTYVKQKIVGDAE